MAAAVDEVEVLSAVMTSLAVAPLLDIASDMDLEVCTPACRDCSVVPLPH